MDLSRQIMSLLLNILSRLVITFLPRSTCLLTSWLQSPCTVILEPTTIKWGLERLNNLSKVTQQTEKKIGPVRKGTRGQIVLRGREEGWWEKRIGTRVNSKILAEELIINSNNQYLLGLFMIPHEGDDTTSILLVGFLSPREEQQPTQQYATSNGVSVA